MWNENFFITYYFWNFFAPRGFSLQFPLNPAVIQIPFSAIASQAGILI